MRHLFPETLFSGIGMGWPLAGGETRGLKSHRAVAVSGMRDTMRVLDEVEGGLLQDIDLLECTVCPDGCVGGPLGVENRFLAKSRILELVAAAGEHAVVDQKDVSRLYHKNFLSFDHPLEPVESHPLDRDPAKAIRKAKRRKSSSPACCSRTAASAGRPTAGRWPTTSSAATPASKPARSSRQRSGPKPGAGRKRRRRSDDTQRPGRPAGSHGLHARPLPRPARPRRIRGRPAVASSATGARTTSG